MDINSINVNDLERIQDDSAEKDVIVEDNNVETSADSEDENNGAAVNDADSAEEGTTTETEVEEAASADEITSDVDLDAIIKERSNGRIETVDSVSELLDELDQLREKSKIVPEPVFQSERAKQAYEYLKSREGDFGELTTQMHRVLALGDVTKLDAKTAQKEAFMLENNDIPAETAAKYFEARYNQKYGDIDLEDDPAAEFEHIKETKAAKEAIRKMQESFKSQESDKSGEAESLAQSQIDVANEVEKTLKSYGGIEYPFGENGEDKLIISLEDEEFSSFESELKNAMVNPSSIIENALEGMKGKDGNLDWDKYANFVFDLVAKDKIRTKIYNQGFAAGQVSKLKESKNRSDVKNGNAIPAKEEPGFFEAWAAARKK